MAHDVFISHSSSDKTVADTVCAALENAAIRCWIAPRDVQPGRSFAGEITRAIQQSEIMVLIFSGHSNNSEQVLREVQLAVNAHLHIIQFRIEDVHLNDDLRYFLSTPHWLDALTPPLEAHIARLMASINTLLSEPSEPPAVPVRTPRVARTVAPPFRNRMDASILTKRWLARALSLWNERKPFVLGGAAAVIAILIAAFWLIRPKHVPTPPVVHSTFAPLPEISASPGTRPIETPIEQSPENPAMRAYQEWASEPKTAPSVNPANEVQVRRTFILQHDTTVTDANFSPDSKHLVTASRDNTARIWSVETGKSAAQPLLHKGAVTKAVFSPDGRLILTYTEASEAAQLWDAETGRLLGGLKTAAGADPVYEATFSPDGKRIVTQDNNGGVEIWDTQTRSRTGKKMRHVGIPDTAPAFSADGKRIITVAEETARIWDAASGSQIGDSLLKVHLAVFSPDGKRIATAPDSGNASVWDGQTGDKLFEINTVYKIYDLSFNADSKYLVTAAADAARIWDVTTGKQHGQGLRIEPGVSSAAFSADGKRVVTVSAGTARLWDVETTQPTSKPIILDNPANSHVHFSPDGKWLVAAYGQDAEGLWEIGGKTLATTQTAQTNPVVGPPPSSPVSFNSNPQLGSQLSQETATALAQSMVNGVSTGAIELLVSLYGDRIDSMDKGIIGQDGMREEYRRFFERWPQTTWRLTGQVRLELVDQGKYRLTFPIYFSAANSAARKQTSGNAEETLVVAQNVSGDWKIVYQRESILRSARSTQRPVVGRPARGAAPTPSSADQERQHQNMEEIARQLQGLIPHR